jgi:Amino acid synthesis
MKLKIRRTYTFVETRGVEAGRDAEVPLRKVAAVAVIENPYAGRYVEDLSPMIAASAELGAILAKMAGEALAPYKPQSFGKAGIVGTAGEQEHANALLTTTFAEPMREVAGGGAAWISSMTKIGVPGQPIDVPLNAKDALYVRSHYDGISLTLHDAPLPDEIAIICCFASRGRLNARVGGLKLEDARGVDGLR